MLFPNRNETRSPQKAAGLALMHAFPAAAEARNGDGTGPDGRGPRPGAPCDNYGPNRMPPRDGRGPRNVPPCDGRPPRPRNDMPRGHGPGNGPRDGYGPRPAPL